MLKRLHPKVVLPHRDVLVSLAEDKNVDQQVRERAADVLEILDPEPDSGHGKEASEPQSSKKLAAASKIQA